MTQGVSEGHITRSWLAGAFGLALAIRLPLVIFGKGLGNDLDAYGVLLASRTIHASGGEYIVSRFPGYPLYEYLTAPLAFGPLQVLVGLNALLAALATSIFAAIWLQHRRRDLFWPAVVAFATAPTVVSVSLCNQEHTLSLCLLLLALWSHKRPLVSGALAGLAIGARPGFAISAMCLATFRDRWPLRLLTAVIIATACFVPAFLAYGTHFIRAYNVPAGTPIISFLRVFGVPMTIVLGVLLVASLRVRPRQPWTDFDRVVALTATLTFASFFLFPLEPAYALPLIPTLLLTIGKTWPDQWTLRGNRQVTVLALVLLGCLIDLDRTGPYVRVLKEYRESQEMYGRAEKAAELLRNPRNAVVLGYESVVVSTILGGVGGDAEGRLRPIAAREKLRNVRLRMFATPEDIRSMQAQGLIVYTDRRALNEYMANGTNLVSLGVRVLE